MRLSNREILSSYLSVINIKTLASTTLCLSMLAHDGHAQEPTPDYEGGWQITDVNGLPIGLDTPILNIGVTGNEEDGYSFSLLQLELGRLYYNATLNDIPGDNSFVRDAQARLIWSVPANWFSSGWEGWFGGTTNGIAYYTSLPSELLSLAIDLDFTSEQLIEVLNDAGPTARDFGLGLSSIPGTKVNME